MKLARKITYQRGEAEAWFYLGLALESVNREDDAIDAYRNARELYQSMKLGVQVQDCDKAIEHLSLGEFPKVIRRRFLDWLSRLWHFVKRR